MIKFTQVYKRTITNSHSVLSSSILSLPFFINVRCRVSLGVSGVTFKAHRLILAACSKHFQELFEGMPPSPAGLIVILDGTSAHNMASLLEFMYRGEVHVSQESLSSFLKAAECLQVCACLFFLFRK